MSPRHSAATLTVGSTGYLACGKNTANTFFNDIWSTSDGLSWQLINSSPGFGARSMTLLLQVPATGLFMLTTGTYVANDGTCLNDVYTNTAMTGTWSSAGLGLFKPLCSAAGAGMGSFVYVAAGYFNGGGQTNDVSFQSPENMFLDFLTCFLSR